MGVPFALILLGLLAFFVWRSLSSGKWAFHTRRAALFDLADAALMMVLLRELGPWGTWGAWPWYLALIGFAAGVFGVVKRWPALPAQSEKRGRTRRIIFGTIHAAVLVGILVLVLG